MAVLSTVSLFFRVLYELIDSITAQIHLCDSTMLIAIVVALNIFNTEKILT